MSTVWTQKHSVEYATSDWIDKPSIFAGTAISYFPKTGKILELGAGQGQDSRFFAKQGYTVVSTDLEQPVLDISKEKLPQELAGKLTLQQVDLREPLPFADAKFDVVYAHLSLHYFSKEGTERLFAEIHRVLKNGGVLAFLVNSTSDPEAVAGTEIEPDYRQVGQHTKRFFTVDTAKVLIAEFSAQLLDDKGETYKDRSKGVRDLIRFIGTKQG